MSASPERDFPKNRTVANDSVLKQPDGRVNKNKQGIDDKQADCLAVGERS